MADRAALVEALDEIENGMCRIAATRDIWQHRLLYALCQGVRLLLEDKLKEKRKARRGKWLTVKRRTVNAWGEMTTTIQGWKCSECGKPFSAPVKTCPYCDAEMEEWK